MTAADARIPVRRALVSAYDKTGLPALVRGLARAGVELVSTGGSARLVEQEGLSVTRVEELTGFPECLDGRVKTLHPAVHAGLLADRRRDDHERQLADLGIAPFDLVVSNLYPFAEAVASGAEPDECVEQIDIGGPSMVRAAAKNHPSVAIVTSPDRYEAVLQAVADGGFTLGERQRLAAEAFRHTASYDVAVASWMGTVLTDTSVGDEASTGFPAWIGGTWERARVLRYGENPHQRAALYTDPAGTVGGGLAGAEQRHGKEMSYNNYTDADAALRAAHDHQGRACVAVVKHANPCGIAVGEEDEDIAAVHARAHACDPLSAFGGIIATNRPVTRAMAETVRDIFTEVVLAPSFDDDALAVLTQKKNLRLLQVEPAARGGIEQHEVAGGLLVQARDALDAAGTDTEGRPTGDDPSRWRLVAGPPADEETLADLAFAWRAIRSVKSNAILLAHACTSVGVGMGQVNRVDACELAVRRAGDRAAGSVAASDAFFPFPDGLQVLLDAGVRAVVQPAGSVRDPEVIAVAEAAGVTMYATGTRHFWH